jgi:hypothetical protein
MLRVDPRQRDRLTAQDSVWFATRVMPGMAPPDGRRWTGRWGPGPGRCLRVFQVRCWTVMVTVLSAGPMRSSVGVHRVMDGRFLQGC